ncbi:Uncharacterised protein [Raoultella planticola]|uniref:Uncharacterized protein n=1 Tax=Raoultella planticola TaxID=575 RepID=A0A485AVK7_RAOPL|nr:Uncharacterised protein [Raoultella planticola]
MSGFDKLTLNDGSYLYFKDWGSGQPVVVQPRLAVNG